MMIRYIGLCFNASIFQIQGTKEYRNFGIECEDVCIDESR